MNGDYLKREHEILNAIGTLDAISHICLNLSMTPELAVDSSVFYFFGSIIGDMVKQDLSYENMIDIFKNLP